MSIEFLYKSINIGTSPLCANVFCAPEESLNDFSLHDHAIQILLRFGVAHVQLFEGLHQHGGNDQVAVPLAVGRDDVPRGVFRAGLAEGVFVGLFIVGPAFALLQVAEAEFPLLGGWDDEGQAWCLGGLHASLSQSSPWLNSNVRLQ